MSHVFWLRLLRRAQASTLAAALLASGQQLKEVLQCFEQVRGCH